MRVSLQAWAAGELGEKLERVEVVRNGEVIRTMRPGTAEFETSFDIQESQTAWYIVRCFGTAKSQIAISNPVYFEAPDYRAPVPEQAHVELQVIDATTGKPLDGKCEVLKAVGRTLVVLDRTSFRHGQSTILTNATARFRISSVGYETQVKSVFMDYKPLLDSVLNMRPEQLTDWRTFENFKMLLDRVELKVSLSRTRTHS
jgi:hypothetical protein